MPLSRLFGSRKKAALPGQELAELFDEYKGLRPVDLRQMGNDPRLLGYFCRPVVVTVSTNLGRGHFAYPVGDAQHPWELAARLALRSEQPFRDIVELLHDYHLRGKPGDLLEYMDVTEAEAPALAGLPPSQAFRPWDPRPMEFLARKKAGRKRKTIDRIEQTRKGAEIAAHDLLELIESVSRDGILRHDGPGGDITAALLQNNSGQWRWQVRDGNHRAMVFSALGFKEIPVRCVQLVRRDEATLWPAVREGAYSPELAEKLFDRVFDAHVPARVANWLRDRGINLESPAP